MQKGTCLPGKYNDHIGSVQGIVVLCQVYLAGRKDHRHIQYAFCVNTTIVEGYYIKFRIKFASFHGFDPEHVHNSIAALYSTRLTLTDDAA